MILLTQISAAVRRDVLLEVLQVQESSLAPLPVHLKLPVAATAFWLRNAKPAPSAHQLQALLLFMVYGELSWNTHQGSLLHFLLCVWFYELEEQ